jgi:hypothetical protein
MIIAVFVAGSMLLLVGVALTAFFAPRSLRDLRRMKDAEALGEWKSAPPERKRAIREAWRHGSAVDTENAGLAVRMSEHVDRVVAATNRISWWVCAPLVPGMLLVIASVSQVGLLIVGAPLVLWLALQPVAARSRKRRRRSIDLTKKQHALQQPSG